LRSDDLDRRSAAEGRHWSSRSEGGDRSTGLWCRFFFLLNVNRVLLDSHDGQLVLELLLLDVLHLLAPLGAATSSPD
jgi:hypothetical protein